MFNDHVSPVAGLLQIKSPTAEQLPTVVELDQLCLNGLWNLEGYQRELSSPNSELFIASVVQSPTRETIIGAGCLWAIVEEAHITLLMVHPKFRGQGIGGLLLYWLLNQAVDRGLERATLEVKASNQNAQSLYHKFGFQRAGCRKGYYKKSGEDALILWHGDLQTPEFRLSLQKQASTLSTRLARLWQLEV